MEQKTTIYTFTVKDEEENESLLPQMPPMKTPDYFRV
jgi:hypothetical protein